MEGGFGRPPYDVRPPPFFGKTFVKMPTPGVLLSVLCSDQNRWILSPSTFSDMITTASVSTIDTVDTAAASGVKLVRR